MTNSTNDTNDTKTEFEDNELSQNISKWINSNYTESSENLENDASEIKQNEDNEKLDIVEEKNNVTNQTAVEETKNDNLDLQLTSGKNLSKSLISLLKICPHKRVQGSFNIWINRWMFLLFSIYLLKVPLLLSKEGKK